MKKIWCITKKNILFQRKAIMTTFGFLIFWMIVLGIEKNRGIVDVNEELYSLAIAGFGIIPAIYACRIEQSLSTEAFLRSLPIQKKDTILGMVLFIWINTIAVAFLLGIQSCLFHLDYPVYCYFWGITGATFIGSIYLALVYLKEFKVAQIFFLCFFACSMKITEYRRLLRKVFNNDDHPLYTIMMMILLIILSTYIVYILIKKER